MFSTFKENLVVTKKLSIGLCYRISFSTRRDGGWWMSVSMPTALTAGSDTLLAQEYIYCSVQIRDI